ncbi:MAG: hypothetical protein U1B82_11625 [Cypionkella sp.]|nr:hypothetical protein [Cypionkella sp.]
MPLGKPDSNRHHAAANFQAAALDLGLKDKVVIVTGGSVGIGAAISQTLAEEGPSRSSSPAAPHQKPS